MLDLIMAEINHKHSFENKITTDIKNATDFL